MRYCTHCGKLVNENDKFCYGCGAALCDNLTSNNQQSNAKSVDKNNAGYNILSFLWPLVGLVLYLVWKDDYPIRAKGCGKWALISVIVEVVLSICYFMFILFMISISY